MPRVSDIYSSRFLNASELAPLGKRHTAVVHAATEETIGQEQKQVLILDLVTSTGKPWSKPVVLNKSNALLMAAVFGNDTDHWLGQRITIWAENVMFRGQWVPGIKVQPIPPAAPGAAVPLAPALSAGKGSTATPQSVASSMPTPTAPAPTQPGKFGDSEGSDLDDEIPFP